MTANNRRDVATPVVVLDESTLIYDPQAPSHYRQAEVHIARRVVENLADTGSEQTEFARNARESLNWLVDNLSTDHDDAESNDPRITIDVDVENSLILATQLQTQYADRSVTLVTRDAGTRIMAHALGIAAKNHLPFGQNDTIAYSTGIHRLVGLNHIAQDDQATISMLSSIRFEPNELVLADTDLNNAVVTQCSSDDPLKLHRPTEFRALVAEQSRH